MDGGVVLIGGRGGSLVVLLATGGNSPFAETEYDIYWKDCAFFPLQEQQWNPVGVNTEELSKHSSC